jgi:hypothetical protein
MYRILFSPDIRQIQEPDTGYPVRARHRISGQILDWTKYIFGKLSNIFFLTALTIIEFCKH